MLPAKQNALWTTYAELDRSRIREGRDAALRRFLDSMEELDEGARDAWALGRAKADVEGDAARRHLIEELRYSLDYDMHRLPHSVFCETPESAMSFYACWTRWSVTWGSRASPQYGTRFVSATQDEWRKRTWYRTAAFRGRRRRSCPPSAGSHPLRSPAVHRRTG